MAIEKRSSAIIVCVLIIGEIGSAGRADAQNHSLRAKRLLSCAAVGPADRSLS